MTPRASAPEARANERDLMAHLKALIRERVPLETGCPLCDEIKGRLGAAPARAPTREADARLRLFAETGERAQYTGPEDDETSGLLALRADLRALLAARPDADACAATLREPKWIRFVEVGTSASGKTRRWTVVAKDSRQRIGDISWYGHWRRYAFAAVSDCVFEQDCLRDIAAFCEDETRKHRAAALASGTEGANR